MSADRGNSPPFGRGETFYGTDGTIDSNNLGGGQYEGQVKVFEDVLYSASGSVKPGRGVNQDGAKVICRCVRNKSGATLYGGRLVQIDPANPGRVSGYQNANFNEAYPVDEFLPAAGVRDNDLFWIVIGGPAIVKTPMSGAEFISTSIAAGALLGAGTSNAGSTQAGTTGVPGRAVGNALAAATTHQAGDVLNVAINYIGRAISAMTSGQTDSPMLADIRSPRRWA